MSQSQYKLVLVSFGGIQRNLVCHAETPGTPLAALVNYLALQRKVDSECDLRQYIEEADVKNWVSVTIKQVMAEHLRSRMLSAEEVHSKQVSLLATVESLASSTTLSPANVSCSAFSANDTVHLFHSLHIRLLHGWLLDPEDKILQSSIKNRSYDKVVTLVEDLQKLEHQSSQANQAMSAQSKSRLARIKSFIDTSKDHLTKHGLSTLHTQIGDGHFAVLYFKNRFNVVHKFNGDLFVLETDEHILTSIQGSMWKKLSLEEDESFYVTNRFSPVKKQPNAAKANEWWQMKLLEFDEPAEAAPKEKVKPKRKLRQRNLAKEMQYKQAEKPSTCALVYPPEAPAKTFSVADKFLKFLTEFQDGNSMCKAPHFEGVAIGMRHTGQFKLNVPYRFLERYDGDLAIDIQDQQLSIHDELLNSAATFLCNHGFDKKEAAENAKLEIIDLPEPKSTQKFLQFVEENEIVRSYKLYGTDVDNTTTYIGRVMGLGYINHMFDIFDAGKCWGKEEGWDVAHLEVRNNGKVFVINKEPDQNVSQDLVVYNLLKFCDKILLPFEGKEFKRYPAFFDSLQKDCLHAADPNGDPQRWERYVKLMRSPLALKAPMVRCGLISNIHRVLSLELLLHSSGFGALTKRNKSDWRPLVRNVEPFLHVYNYRNDVSLSYTYDKWDCSDWHVLKYVRHCIEHILYYIRTNSLLHDTGIVELMVARRLENDIGNAIRKIVLDYGVDEKLSSAWACYEASDCKIMPLQLPLQGESAVLGNFQKENGGTEENFIPEETLLIHLSTGKPSEHEICWAYLEVGGTYNPSSELASQKSIHLALADFKKLLENNGFHVGSFDDTLSREDYILVRKIANREERSSRDSPEVAIEGRLCDEYRTILEHLERWLSRSCAKATSP